MYVVGLGKSLDLVESGGRAAGGGGTSAVLLALLLLGRPCAVLALVLALGGAAADHLLPGIAGVVLDAGVAPHDVADGVAGLLEEVADPAHPDLDALSGVADDAVDGRPGRHEDAVEGLGVAALRRAALVPLEVLVELLAVLEVVDGALLVGLGPVGAVAAVGVVVGSGGRSGAGRGGGITGSSRGCCGAAQGGRRGTAGAGRRRRSLAPRRGDGSRRGGVSRWENLSILAVLLASVLEESHACDESINY
mmetsp:Transcript_22331/g.52929  ORF Transcript_22331/g.52929 Transcript_22331/m.52929 type:complete len:250 (-) Transcript_22331:265-1014(-)